MGCCKAQSVMRELMPFVDLCIVNDEDFESSLGIRAYDGDISRGIDQIDSYQAGMQEIIPDSIQTVRQLPVCCVISVQLRMENGWEFI